LPEGVTANYTGNNQTAVGTYNVFITLVDTTGNYNVGSTTKQLVITKGVYDLSGIKFENKQVLYDEQSHSILIQGELPDGVSVTYENNGQTKIGTYTIRAKFTVDTNCYQAIPDMTATLTISPNPAYAKLTFVGEQNYEFYVLKGTAFTDAPELEKRLGYEECWDADLTNITQDLVIRPKYTLIVYTIEYILNGGEAINPQTYTIETSITLSKPTRKGFDFVGWTSEQNQEPTKDLTVANETGNKKFTAHWQVKEYTVSGVDYGVLNVTFKDADDTTTYATRQLKMGSTMSVPSNPTKEGCVFNGWYKDKECTQFYRFDQAIKQDLTLYAGFLSDSNKAYASYGERKIIEPSQYNSSSKFYSFQISGYTETTLRQTLSFVINETRVYEPQNPNPFRIYYRNSSSDSNYDIGMQLYNETKQTVIKNATLAQSSTFSFAEFYADAGDVISIYAHCNFLNDMLIYFTNVNEMPCATSVSSEKLVTYGENYQLPYVELEGKLFEGYYTQANGKGTKITDNLGNALSIYEFDTNITVYPYYTLIPYEISYNVNGGELEDKTKDLILQFTIESEDIVLPNMVKNGYDFDGWYTDEDFTNKIETIVNGTHQNVQVYAKFIPQKYMITGLDVEYITVNFDKQDGSLLQAVRVDFGTTLQPPADPTRNGYVFKGWYLDQACTQIFDFTGKITDMTLYAGWMSTSNLRNKSTYSHSVINPAQYKSSSSRYSLSIPQETTSDKPARIVFRANETFTGNKKIIMYYKSTETSSSYNYYLSIYNETQKKYIVNNQEINSTSSSSFSFNANNGDIISVTAYKKTYYNTISVYFSNYSAQKSNTTMEAEKEVTFDQNFTLPYVTLQDKQFVGYFTEENGQGTQITDNLGNSLIKYNYTNDIKVYSYYN